MRSRVTVAVGLLLFAACVLAPIPPVPRDPEVVVPLPGAPADEASIVEAMVRAGALGAAASLAAPSALPSQTLVDGPIEITVSGHFGAHRCVDGTWSIHAPQDLSCHVTAIRSSDGPCRWGMNIPGDFNGELAAGPLPIPFRSGDALVVLSGGGTPSSATALVGAGYPVGPGQLRGPAIGAGYLPWFFRTAGPFLEASVDMSQLTDEIDLDWVYSPTGGKVDPNRWQGFWLTPQTAMRPFGGGKFMADIFGDWRVAGRVPPAVNPGYGTNVAAALSSVYLLLNSKLPVEQKRPIALWACQAGIDQVGAIASLPNWRRLYPSGGHCWGRKGLVVLTGHLMHIDVFRQSSAILGPSFAEDYFKAGPWWHGEPGWTSVWPFSTQSSHDGRQFANHPSSWGPANDPTHGSFAWAVAYSEQVGPALLGTATAFQLMGIGGDLNPHLVAFCKQQHSVGLPTASANIQAAMATMRALGISCTRWGTDDVPGANVPLGVFVACESRWGR